MGMLVCLTASISNTHEYRETQYFAIPVLLMPYHRLTHAFNTHQPKLLQAMP